MIKKLIPLPKFHRDYNKAKKKHFSKTLIHKSIHLLKTQNHKELYRRCRDHALHGDMQGYRELHIMEYHDLLLLYQIQTGTDGLKELILVRLGSHDDLYK